MLLPGKGPDGASGTAGLQAVPGDLVQKPPLFLFSHGRKDAVGEGEINERIKGHMVGPGFKGSIHVGLQIPKGLGWKGKDEIHGHRFKGDLGEGGF